jgi:hypothetical protein
LYLDEIWKNIENNGGGIALLRLLATPTFSIFDINSSCSIFIFYRSVSFTAIITFFSWRLGRTAGVKNRIIQVLRIFFPSLHIFHYADKNKMHYFHVIAKHRNLEFLGKSKQRRHDHYYVMKSKFCIIIIVNLP